MNNIVAYSSLLSVSRNLFEINGSTFETKAIFSYTGALPWMLDTVDIKGNQIQLLIELICHVNYKKPAL